MLSVVSGHIVHQFAPILGSHSICLFTYDIAYESIKALVVESGHMFDSRIHIQ